MENVSIQILELYKNKSEVIDFIAKEQFLKSESKNEILNFSLLKITEAITILKENPSLWKDFFTFNLYTHFQPEDLLILVKTMYCPFKHITKFVEYLLTEYIEKKKEIGLHLIEQFLIKNVKHFTELEILHVLKKMILRSDLFKEFKEEPFEIFQKDADTINQNMLNNNGMFFPIYLTSILLQTKIDQQFLLEYLKDNKDLQFSTEELINMFYIISFLWKYPKLLKVEDQSLWNMIDYFSIISDLFIVYYIEKKISTVTYEQIKKDLEMILESIKEKKGIICIGLKSSSSSDIFSLRTVLSQFPNEEVSIEQIQI